MFCCIFIDEIFLGSHILPTMDEFTGVSLLVFGMDLFILDGRLPLWHNTHRRKGENDFKKGEN